MLKPIIKDRDQASNIYKGRFEAADDNGRTKITDEAWNDATAAWPASALKGSWQRDQLDALSVLWRYQLTVPVLEICPKITEAVEAARSRFPA